MTGIKEILLMERKEKIKNKGKEKGMKLVVSDLDGTLLNEESEVTQETIEAINKLVAKGINFAIATGRSFNSANRIREKIGIDIYMICNNGANIYNKNGSLLKRNVMSSELIARIVKFLTKNKIEYFAFDGRGRDLYVAAGTYIESEFLVDHDPHYIETESDMKNIPALEKILIIEEDPEKIFKLKDLIEKEFSEEVEIVISADDCIDLNIKGCSKKAGVEFISQELGIEPEKIMAFGDSGNDYRMLKFVGHPVAVKDSYMASRDFENQTEFTNYENGVAEYLKKYFEL